MRRRDGSRGRRQNPNTGQNRQPSTGYRQEAPQFADGQAQPPVKYVMVPVPVEQAMPFLTGQQTMSQPFYVQPPFNYAPPKPTANYQPPQNLSYFQHPSQSTYDRGQFSQGNLNILGDSSDTDDRRSRNPSNRSRHANRTQQSHTVEDVDENDVFTFLLKRFAGACTYEEFSRDCNLFQNRSSIPAWFSKHGRKFNIYRDGGNIVYMSVFYKDMKICKHYISRQSCKRNNCNFFHICRKFVRGNCKNKECPLSHSFKTIENRKIKEKLGINQFTDADIKIVLNSNSPAVCPDYIYENGCKLQDSEKRCPYLHLCRFYVFGKCKHPCKDKKTHSIEQFHNKWVLKSCHMKDWGEADVLREVIVPPRKGGNKPNDSDVSDDDDITGSDFLSDGEEVQYEDEETLSSSLDHSFENLQVVDYYGFENDKTSAKLSRRDRFKSVEGEETDESGLLSVAGAIPKKPRNYEELDIKEKERLLMEEWTLSQAAKSSAAVNRNYLRQEAEQFEDITTGEINRPESLLTSNKSGSRQLFERKTSEDEKTDLRYQEKNRELLADDSDQTNICIFVKRERCMSRQCTYHHLKSGLPYLWQIKLFGQWISFSTGENIMIERCYCDLLGIADAQVVCDLSPYNIHIFFDDQMYGVIYDVDGNPGSHGDIKLSIRRLSSPSYVEDTTTHRFYATQWRWYYRGDSWCKYDESTQIKLEKSYMSKKSTVECGATYIVMIDKMEQINMATKTIRQIIRRPLFVSLTDIMDGKFPKQILPNN